MKYNVYRINEETGEILNLLHEGITDISSFKDGMYDKKGYFVTINKESRIQAQ